MRKTKLMPLVVVYKDVFDNLDETMFLIKELEKKENENIIKWETWRDFGILTHLNEEGIFSSNNLSDEKKQLLKDANQLSKKLYKTFYKCYDDYIENYVNSEFVNIYNEKAKRDPFMSNIFNDYVKNWNYKYDINPEIEEMNDENCWDYKINNLKDGWMSTSIDLVKYNKDYWNNYILQYHVDDGNFKINPGPHSILSTLLYLNDDYDEGYVSFINEFDDTIINYKPKAGDLIVFPSNKPFFHAALPAKNNNKYFARHFLTWNYLGSEEWHENNKKYDKDGWKLIQQHIRKIEEEFGVYTKDVVLPGEVYSNTGRHNGKPFIVQKVVEIKNDW